MARFSPELSKVLATQELRDKRQEASDWQRAPLLLIPHVARSGEKKELRF